MALKPLLLATQPFYSAHHVLRIGATPPESRADIRRLIRLDFCVFFCFRQGDAVFHLSKCLAAQFGVLGSMTAAFCGFYVWVIL